jgi:prephenate dehydratase
MKISYLGPEGSYSHIAAVNIFSDKSEFVPATTITNALHDLSSGLVDKAIVPVENSSSGGVAETIEAFQRIENVYINNEYILPIKHALLVPNSVEDLTSITEIRAHHMALNQCMDFIRNNLPNAEILPSSSNSSAAKRLAQSLKENPELKSAVIASEFCHEIYDLKLAKSEINDSSQNETRFWVCSKEPADLNTQAKNKTTVLFQTKDEPGSLQTVLRLFAVNNINLSRIESRPAKKNIGEYLFLIDFDLHRDDARYEELLRQAKQHFSYYKWLGSYSLID